MTIALRNALRLLGALSLVALLGGCGKNAQPAVPRVQVPLSSLVIAPHRDTLQVAGVVQMTAVAKDTLGAVVGDPAIDWRSRDNAIVQVNVNGVVTAVSEGASWVVASSGGRSDSCAFLVTGTAGWTVQPSAAAGADLEGIYFTPAGREGWAVGKGGRIVHTADAGAHWAVQVSSTAFNLNSVWFTSDLSGVAVGNGGTVMNTTDGGTTWTRNSNVTISDNLYDVRFIDGFDGWAVGSSGRVLRTTDGGATWASRTLATVFALHSVAFSGLDGWTVGDGGAVFGSHDGGASWYALSIGTSQPLHGVWRYDHDHSLAVGQVGTTAVALAGADSVVWSLPATNAGANNQLEKVQLQTTTLGWAVGFNAGTGGVVLQTTDGGQTWSNQVSNTAGHLNGVFFVDALRGWAVGDAGIIIHTGNGGGP